MAADEYSVESLSTRRSKGHERQPEVSKTSPHTLRMSSRPRGHVADASFGAKNAVLDPDPRDVPGVRDLKNVCCLSSLVWLQRALADFADLSGNILPFVCHLKIT